ncbi:MAG: ABC transporter ATP-binding protein/permease [Christensenellaceae bacterium]|jgi:ATP-binding cassette subfamily B protein|nr:ABC transporter ATP-binding protein/permease [Christensenellaceae bacterium]
MDNWAEKEPETVKLKFFGLGKILPYIKPYRKTAALLCVLLVGDSLCSLAVPLFQRYAIDVFIAGRSLSGFPAFVALFLAVLVSQMVFGGVWARLAINIEMFVGRDLKRTGFNHLQTLSFTYFNQNAVGYIHARVMNDTNRIASMLSWGVVDSLWSLVTLLGSFGIMLRLHWKLALIVIAIMPFAIVIGSLFQKKLIAWNRRVREINSRITGNFNEGITGAKTTKTLVIEGKIDGEFRAATAEMHSTAVRTSRFSALFISTTTFLTVLSISLVLYYGGQLTREGLMLIGTLSAFTSYALSLINPIQNLAGLLTELITTQVNIERFTRLLATKPDITDRPEVVAKYGDVFAPKRENWEPIKGDIEFRDVSFRYPDGTENVLEHFSLHVPAGACVAIVGETGAGKSTLVNLVCRFYEPSEGQILLDGRDTRERSQLWLHENIGYVLQSPHLFSGSVRENLLYGRPDATDEEIAAAVRAVSAEGIIERLEQGYDTDVGESGDLLSTGEKQLLSFARAILANPRIFVLDEATSSVDTLTEQLIQRAIERLLSGRTSFLIAHRLSTIRRADLILVVRAGKIVEQGSHEELLARRGYYHALYTQQYEEEATSELLERALGAAAPPPASPPGE